MSDAIRFLLGGDVHTVKDVNPTMTVLDYVRQTLGRTGAKEGCREGDCGACTMVLGELRNGRVQYRAVNTCILFLPALDGKELVTVESLSAGDGSLHPVQQAMVDKHGSQCGFCTPGIVMALYELYLNDRTPDLDTVNDALAGNLCRCTGYGPIIAAAQSMGTYTSNDAEPNGAALKDIQRDRPLTITHESADTEQTFHYVAPQTLTDLHDLLEKSPKATILAGGTDVGLWVTKRLKDLNSIIDVTRVRELKQIIESKRDLTIGAGVTYTDLFAAIQSLHPSFGELVRRLGSVQVRNSGTMGGNIANGSPIGDSMPALIALGATLIVSSKNGTRELPIEDFFIAYGEQDLRPGEILERIRIPKPSASDKISVYKISKRFDQDISAACLAVRATIRQGTVADIRIGVGGLAAIPKRAPATEHALRGAALADLDIETACRALRNEFDPISDMRASAEYRLKATQSCLYKAYLEWTGESQALGVIGRDHAHG